MITPEQRDWIMNKCRVEGELNKIYGEDNMVSIYFIEELLTANTELPIEQAQHEPEDEPMNIRSEYKDGWRCVTCGQLTAHTEPEDEPCHSDDYHRGVRYGMKLRADADALTARPVAWKDMPPSSFGVDFGATLESDTEPEDGEE